MTQPPYGPPPTAPQGQPQTYAQTPPGQPPYGGQQPYGAPQVQTPAKKPFYKKTWFIILAVIVAIGVIASAAGGETTDSGTDAAADTGTGSGANVDAPAGGEAPTGEAAPVADEPAESSDPGIGQPAADGDFSFVVNGVDCSLTEIGSQYFSTTAQGQFCVVDVTITNIGDEAQSFFGDNAKLFNAQGQKFSADSEASIYLEDSASLYEEINPGNTLTSKVVFDVPAGTTPTAIELHDSMFSGGVRVNLQ